MFNVTSNIKLKWYCCCSFGFSTRLPLLQSVNVGELLQMSSGSVMESRSENNYPNEGLRFSYDLISFSHTDIIIRTSRIRYSLDTPVLKELHGLPVQYRMEYNTLTIAYKALHGQSPGYTC